MQAVGRRSSDRGISRLNLNSWRGGGGLGVAGIEEELWCGMRVATPFGGCHQLDPACAGGSHNLQRHGLCARVTGYAGRAQAAATAAAVCAEHNPADAVSPGPPQPPANTDVPRMHAALAPRGAAAWRFTSAHAPLRNELLGSTRGVEAHAGTGRGCSL